MILHGFDQKKDTMYIRLSVLFLKINTAPLSLFAIVSALLMLMPNALMI